MAFSITSLEHALGSAAKEAVSLAHKLRPILENLEAAAPVIEEITSLISPAAVLIEQSAFGVLGKILAALPAPAPKSTAPASTSVSITLTPEEAAELAVVLAALKSAAVAKVAN